MKKRKRQFTTYNLDNDEEASTKKDEKRQIETKKLLWG